MKRIEVKTCGHLLVTGGKGLTCVCTHPNLKELMNLQLPENRLAVRWLNEADTD